VTEPAPAGVSDLDWEIFSVTNKMRTDPSYFILYLLELLPLIDEERVLHLPGNRTIWMKEGAEAVADGIEYLRS